MFVFRPNRAAVPLRLLTWVMRSFLILRNVLKTPVGLSCEAVERLRCPAFFKGETPSVPDVVSRVRKRNPSKNASKKAQFMAEEINRFAANVQYERGTR